MDMDMTVDAAAPPHQHHHHHQHRHQRSVKDFQVLSVIGQGSYGTVYKARDTKTGSIVAVKSGNPKYPRSTHAEMKHLNKMDHPFIIKLREVVAGLRPNSVLLVMDYAHTDLWRYISSLPAPLAELDVKRLMYMLLDGLRHLHRNGIVHRDIKLSNLLLTRQGVLKIADFGMSCGCGGPSARLPYKHIFGTRTYWAPEVALPLREYTAAVDIWAAGCVMAELLAKEPLFTARDDTELMMQMCWRIGTPEYEAMPEIHQLLLDEDWVPREMKQPSEKLRQRFPELSAKGYDLLRKLLEYDPAKRISAQDALDHIWFSVPNP